MIIPEGYVRVTQVLKPFVQLDNIPADKLAYAQDRGTRTHRLCELYALGKDIGVVPDDCKCYFRSFKAWFDRIVDEVFLVEHRVFNHKHKITGQIDLLCRFKGCADKVLVDYKATASPYKSWSLQSAAYKWLLENEGFKVDRRLCLQLNREGGFPNVREYQDARDIIRFLSALDLYDFFYR